MLGETTWSEARIAELKRLWSEGLSTAEIARRLAISKNAVVGKAHRLNLRGRPSPIQVRLPERKNPIGPTAPPRRRTSEPQVPRLPYPPGAIEALASARDRAPMEAPSVRSQNPATNAATNQLSASHTCCWPLGEPGSQLFRFCNYQVAANKPYCEAHCRAAYVKATMFRTSRPKSLTKSCP
jgi:GcrA cell cycle regulator